MPPRENAAQGVHADRPHVGVEIPGAPVGSLLLQVGRAHARVGTSLLGRVGIAPPHEIVLLYLDEHRPVSQTELVHYLGRDRSTVTATLQAMERANLIERTSSALDRRQMMVELTDHGRAMLAPAKKAWQALEALTTTALTGAQRAQLIVLLEAVRDTLNGAEIDDDL